MSKIDLGSEIREVLKEHDIEKVTGNWLFDLLFPPITGIAIYFLTELRTLDTLLFSIIWTVFWWFVLVGSALEDLHKEV